MSADLASKNYKDVKDTTFDFVVLPWGATEPHNYHLPYLTDCYLANSIAIESTELAKEKYKINGIVLPPISLGSQNPGQTNLPFCIHTRYETQRLVLKDILESLRRQGQLKVLLMNGHGGNNFKNMIRDFSLDYPDMSILVCDWFRVLPSESYFISPDDHAGDMETSVLMYYHPELVKLELAGDGYANPFNIDALNKGQVWTPRNWSKVSKDTGVGDPRQASAGKGEKYAKAVCEVLANFYNDWVTKQIY